LVSAWSIAQSDPADLKWSSGVEVLSEILPPGIYVLQSLGGQGKEAIETLNSIYVSKIQATVSLHANPEVNHRALLWDAVSRQPLQSVNVKGIKRHGRAKALPWESTTDDAGVFEFPFSNSSASNSTPIVIAGAADGQPFFIHSSEPHASPILQADLIVDRPLHRPGETLSWKLIMRDRAAETWQSPSDFWNLTIRNADHETVYESANVSLNEFGAIDGVFTIPVTSKPGEFTLHVISTTSNRRQFSASLGRIDNYVPPALHGRIRYAGPAEGLRPSGEFVAEISAQYLSGSPAVGCPVELTIAANHRSSPFYEIRSYHEPLKPITVQAETDAAGVAIIRWQIPPHISENASLKLNAQLLPLGGQPVQIEATWQLSESGQPFELTDHQKPQLVTPGQPTTVRGKIINGSGESTRFQGQAEWVRLVWQEAFLKPNGEVVDQTALPLSSKSWERHPPSWHPLHRGYVTEPVTDFALETKEDGQFELSFIPPDAGLYALRIMDSQGQSLNGSPHIQSGPWTFPIEISPFHLVAVDQNTKTLKFERTKSLLVAPSTIPQHAPAQALFITKNETETGVATIVREAHSRISQPPGKADFTGST